MKDNFFEKGCIITDSYYICFEIRKYCAQYKLDNKLISAIIYQESRGNIWATKYKDDYYKNNFQNKSLNEIPFYTPSHIPTLTTELKERATSWGLMQILGQKAREYGFNKTFLSSLLLPTNNLKLGCKIIKECFNKCSQEVRNENDIIKNVLLMYNRINNINNKNYPELIERWIISGAYKNVLKDEL